MCFCDKFVFCGLWINMRYIKEGSIFLIRYEVKTSSHFAIFDIC